MTSVENQIRHWRDGSGEEWDVALELMDKGRTRHALFFAHLALEKALKAHVCRAMGVVAPRTHALLRLGELSRLAFSDAQRALLAEFDRYQIEGRYPETLDPPPSRAEADAELSRAKELLGWLMAKF
jgi:HEPN domain-containing protein